MKWKSSRPVIPDSVLTQWQSIVDLLGTVCKVPSALVMRTHESEIEVIVSSRCDDNPYRPGDAELLNSSLYCESVMASRGKLLVPNALNDPDWDHNPDLAWGMVSYLGYPILWPDGEVFGTICILDRKENFHGVAVEALTEQMRNAVEASLAFVCERHELNVAREELREACENLQGRVEQRTAQLTQNATELNLETIKRKQAEEFLRHTRNKWEGYCECTPIGVMIINSRGDFVYVNSKFQEMFGYDLADVPNGRHWFRLAYPDPVYRQQVIADWREDCPNADRVQDRPRTFTVTCKDGNEKLVHFRGVQLPDGQYLISCEDVTSLRRTEEELRSRQAALEESEGRLSAVFESAMDCIYIKDRHRRYTHVNPAMESLFGLPARSIIGKTDKDLFGAAAEQHLSNVDARVLGGESIEEEHTRPVNGNLITFLDHRAPIHQRSGEIIGICGIARNLTGRIPGGTSAEVVTVEYPSRAAQEVERSALIAASHDSTLLLLGETGTGKDYYARWIHARSNRSQNTFLTLDCASVSATLAESELFGHEPGAFTGARGRKRGLVELAEGGTLLLNEIGELSLELQAKLLSFLDTKTFFRVGGQKRISVNARLIAATNRDLNKAIAKGRFRADLFYRLNVLSIRVPPLRERVEDIPIIARELMCDIAKDLGLRQVPALDEESVIAVQEYQWPGNIRELRNLLKREMILARPGEQVRLRLNLPDEPRDWMFSVRFPKGRSVQDITKDVSHALVREALRRSQGSKEDAAKLLGISRHAFLRLRKSVGLPDAYRASL